MNTPTIPNPQAANTLFHMVINEKLIYSKWAQYLIPALQNKFYRGEYDQEDAIRRWEIVATRAAKLDAFRKGGVTYYHIYNAATRIEAAKLLEDYYYTNFIMGC